MIRPQQKSKKVKKKFESTLSVIRLLLKVVFMESSELADTTVVIETMVEN
jgi:hypothetical protein